MNEEYITASYLVHGKQDYHKKAQAIAYGLTVGTWTELAPEKQKALAPHLGHVVEVREVEPGDDGVERAIIRIGYPVVNFTADIPAILTTVFGKLSMDGKIRLIDLELPEPILQQFPGPRFGIIGLRNLLGAPNRPLLMSIFKQCIGLPLDDLQAEYEKQVNGGVDLVKDDEIYFRDDNAPIFDRIKAFEAYNRKHEEKTGRKVLYAPNLTGPVTELVERAKRMVEAGASCLLLNVAPYGFDILHRLAADPDVSVPIMAHPAFTGAMYASPEYGTAAPLLLGKLMRWAGADIVLYPSPYGSVAMPKDEALQVASNLREENGVHEPALPAPAAGIHPGLVPLLYRDFGSDLLVNAGGGVHGHPGGAEAGGKAFTAAISAVVSGKSLAEAAQSSPELRAAIEKWGGHEV
ncbi:2,3-diketo-5-methylthiopentyl-1-phosphate enolase [Aneurinibacillus sp. Ricciae_BoGa-3]|uniref:2,3-diketo-5-methylthiopentyl-1-phosphate enolase n=1 Tax=Aneurinibacillus sp. Ricciae_BoGa-3 TaxID=3022697 RepID=UPI002342222D|nr:2,3-diketo-5-methylthiopentyl-1-phosphate enolase [Aneurinibacillus sp. Ricciae_BoGa-3]WCK56750.1 2,3-diketo-5-methylthiopentyl-1-phosphate enolase [Aneurinibacillus sp. Ricciae_BoGa-3]